MMVDQSDEDGTRTCPDCNDQDVVPFISTFRVDAVTRAGVDGALLPGVWVTCSRCQDRTKDVSGANIFVLNP